MAQRKSAREKNLTNAQRARPPSILQRRIFTLCTKVHANFLRLWRHSHGQILCLVLSKSMVYPLVVDIKWLKRGNDLHHHKTKKQQLLLALTWDKSPNRRPAADSGQKPVYGKPAGPRIGVRNEPRRNAARVKRIAAVHQHP